MKKTLFISSIALLSLTSCATVQTDPTLANGVKRLGGGVYSVSEMSVMFGDPALQAVRQCELDNSDLDIQGTTTKTGMASNTKYAVILFKCRK